MSRLLRVQVLYFKCECLLFLFVLTAPTHCVGAFMKYYSCKYFLTYTFFFSSATVTLFLLVNSEMWIQMAIKLPQNLGVCQKTVGNLARDFYADGGRKTLYSR